MTMSQERVAPATVAPEPASTGVRPRWVRPPLLSSFSTLRSLPALRALPEWVRRGLIEAAAVGIPLVAVLWAVPPFTWSVPVAIIGCLLLPLRHIWPPLALIGGLAGLAGGLGWPAALVALFTMGRRATQLRTTVPWLLLTLVVSVTPVLLTQDLPWQRVALTFAFVGLYAVAPAALGLLLSTRERLTASLAELTSARESAMSASQDAARAQERARIGREIHDAVGHHATLIAVGAAALAASTAEEETRQSAEQIRSLAKRALAEMRAALGLLDAGAEQVAGLAELAALVAGASAAGVDVELVHHGEPVELAPGVGRAVYRVAQESITNAVRHASGSAVRLELRWRTDELMVQVRNTAAPRVLRRRRDAFVRGGTGLMGLAERVTSAGGQLTAAPSPEGGFTVRASFPLPKLTAEVYELHPDSA
ncbi:sensor histidine kinase [Pseudonocardia sp. TRM90224]|uniref:sensor histidine kinase n=1 Tax=Pseudonocardia sp. TRM90224 TaxID=2812678 RepID=UPI001E34D3D5|nr:histidine kinase [Pseudonocardia sp. TRM90224]